MSSESREEAEKLKIKCRRDRTESLVDPLIRIDSFNYDSHGSVVRNTNKF